MFAVGLNDGTIRTWDTRFPAREKDCYTPHMNETTYLDWHPTVPDILLSGGQNGNINAQNLRTSKSVFNIQTADTICKTTWIPDRQYQVSSMRPPYSSAS